MANCHWGGGVPARGAKQLGARPLARQARPQSARRDPDPLLPAILAGPSRRRPRRHTARRRHAGHWPVAHAGPLADWRAIGGISSPVAKLSA